jgi:hypothetical protein
MAKQQEEVPKCVFILPNSGEKVSFVRSISERQEQNQVQKIISGNGGTKSGPEIGRLLSNSEATTLYRFFFREIKAGDSLVKLFKFQISEKAKQETH